MLPPSLQKSKERLERAREASPPSSIERIFAFLHAKAAMEASPASAEIDLLLEVLAETAAELEKEKTRAAQLRRRLSEAEESAIRAEDARRSAESDRFTQHMKSEEDNRELIRKERNLTKALAQARADLETLTLWKTQELSHREKTAETAGSPRRVGRSWDAITEAAELRARRMQQDRLKAVMSKYYYVRYFFSVNHNQ